jgi:hypothetical protein
MISESKYIDQIYHFKGAWDVPSFCGLKIIAKKDKTIVVLTELYDSNPGSSVTSWIDKLATGLIREYEIEPEKLILIEHNPDRKSSLEFFKETFDQVNLVWDGTKFMNPVWERISIEQVIKLLKI